MYKDNAQHLFWLQRDVFISLYFPSPDPFGGGEGWGSEWNQSMA